MAQINFSTEETTQPNYINMFLTPRPNISQEDAQTRAEKYHYTLGDQSPGVSSLYNTIISGREGEFRDQLVRNDQIENGKARLELLDRATKLDGNLSPEHMALIDSLTANPPRNPSTILEGDLAEKIISDLYFTPQEETTTDRAFAQDQAGTNELLDVAKEEMAKQELIRHTLEDAAKGWEDTSTVAKVWDFIKGVVPFYSAANLMNEVEGFPYKLQLEGDNIREQILYLHSLPLDQFNEKFKKAFDSIASSSYSDAVKFAQAVASYSSQENFLDNIINLTDIAAITPIGSARKLLGNIGTRAARTLEGRYARESALEIAARREAQGLEGAPLKAADNAAIELEPIIVSPTDDLAKGLTKTVQANAASKISAPDLLASAGKTEESAVLQTFNNLRTEFSSTIGKTATQAESLLSHIPSFLDPFSIVRGSYKMSREAADRIMERVLRSSNNALRGIVDRTTISRLSDQALGVALEVATASVKREFRNAPNTIMDVAPSFNPFTNTNELRVTFKQASGAPFETREQAKYYATKELKLPNYRIEPEGNGYHLVTTRPYDETVEEVRDALIANATEQTPQSWINTFFGKIRSAEDILSPEHRSARKTAVHGVQKVLNNMRDVLAPVQKLSKSSKRDLIRFTTMLRDSMHLGENGQALRGDFFTNLGEFEEGWYQAFNRMPTEKEAAAYFSYVKYYEMDYILRNMIIYRDKVRQGIVHVTLDHLKNGNALPTIEGKLVNDFNIDNISGRAGFMIWEPNKGGPVFFSRGEADRKFVTGMLEQSNQPLELPEGFPGFGGRTTYKNASGQFINEAEMKSLLESSLGKNYRVVQLADPYSRPLKDATDINDIVNFVITKDFKSAPLPLEQIPYRPGGHVVYDYNWWVKQPKITNIMERKVYFGDTTLRPMETEARAKEFAASYERARQLFNSGDKDAFDTFVKANLPETPNTLRGYFKRGVLSADHPIVPVRSGMRTSEHDTISPLMGGVENSSTNQYNLMRNLNMEFAGERNFNLSDVTNVGTEVNPLFRLDNPKLLDPLSTINRAASSMSRNLYLDDYRIFSAEHFIQEFHDVMNVPLEDLRRNPLAYILDENNHWLEKTTNVDKLSAAKRYKDAVRHLLAINTPLQRANLRVKGKLYDALYNTVGEKAADVIDDKLLASISDPIRFARSVTFSLKLGLFNPLQLWKQAQTLVHAMAVAQPAAALKAAPSYFPVRALMWSNESDKMLSHFAKMMKVFGWKEEDFIEAYRALRKTGIDVIEGEHAWKDNLQDAPIFNGMGRSFYNKNTVFFNEGERSHRIVGFMAAYQEWRMANPFAPLDKRALSKIMLRQDTLSVNMTKASNSAIERGVFTIPQQFFSYQLRLWQQFTSKRLTNVERARALTIYSAMYGIPVGVGGTLFGVWPWYQDISQHLLEQGQVTDPNPVVEALHKGLIELALHLVTGKENNFGESYGPSGLSIFKALVSGDSTPLEVATGASGSTLGQIIKSTYPIIQDIMSVFDDGIDAPKMKVFIKDFEDAARNISTVNNAYLAYYGFVLGKYIAKGEVNLDNDISTVDSVLMGLFGIKPQTIDNFYLEANSLSNQKDAQLYARQQAIKYLRRGFTAENREEQIAFFKQAKIFRILGDIRPDDWTSVVTEAAKGYESLVDRMNERFLFEESPQSQREQRMKALENMRNQ